jgi:hypothetical protein
MTLDALIADLRAAVGRARSEAIRDFLDLAARVRAASTEADRSAVLEEAGLIFAEQPAAVDFLKSMAPVRFSAAQRFARVRVAEIRLYHAAAVKAGRAAGDVYSALRPEMDAARKAYREKFLTPVNGTADYLHGEFVRTLANDDATLLGPAYPGPLAGPLA